uniref:PWWP domain-containing protein n=1 Tax=Entamoeba invadens TaxID=33085 RepID=S0B023_ENTIV|nr:hypothetical protein [Entamoeba invadens]
MEDKPADALSTTPTASPPHSQNMTPDVSPRVPSHPVSPQISTPTQLKVDPKISTPTLTPEIKEVTKPMKSPTNITSPKSPKSPKPLSPMNVSPKEMSNVKLPNWSIVWAKQKGYPWWPAKLVLVDSLPEDQKKPLAKIIEAKRDQSVLVRYFADGYQFGWVNANNIKPFGENFMETVTEKMLGNRNVVDAIDQAMEIEKIPDGDLSVYKTAASAAKKQMEEEERKREAMIHCDIGYFVGDVSIQGFKLEGTPLDKKLQDAQYTRLVGWKSLTRPELVQLLREMMLTAVNIVDVMDQNWKVGNALYELEKENDVEVSTLAGMTLKHFKEETKRAIESGEYPRCIEFYN